MFSWTLPESPGFLRHSALRWSISLTAFFGYGVSFGDIWILWINISQRRCTFLINTPDLRLTMQCHAKTQGTDQGRQSNGRWLLRIWYCSVGSRLTNDCSRFFDYILFDYLVFCMLRSLLSSARSTATLLLVWMRFSPRRILAQQTGRGMACRDCIFGAWRMTKKCWGRED